ncbi:MAG: glycosyltransferase family 4 protein [Halobacteriota archaeon]|nr:glycosyltransferase family 4 protein [Halobacteriota archaeon]
MKIAYHVVHFPYADTSSLTYSEYGKNYLHGGAGVATYHLALNIAERGHEVGVFTTSTIGSKENFEKYENINIHRYKTNFKIGVGNISINSFREPWKYKFDVVHAHSGSVSIAGLTGIQHAKKRNIPLVLTYHADAPENYGGFVRRMGVSFFNKYLIDRVLSYAEVIVCPSEYFIDESRFLKGYKDKIVTIPNGVKINNFDIPYSKNDCRKKLGFAPDENIVLFVGTLVDYKCPDVLIKALTKVVKKIPNVKLVFVGDGKIRNDLELLSKKLMVDDHIKFVGFVGDVFEKALYYKSADVFVLPSFAEVFPLVLLEASASSLPMVVSDLKTLQCIIEDGFNGIVVKKGNEISLADALIHILENEDTRVLMGKNARKKVEKFSWDEIAQKTEKIYYEVTS